jgi:Ca2+-binding EF-hand superfamily protein
MRAGAGAWCIVLAAALARPAHAGKATRVRPAAVRLLFPGGQGPCRLRLNIVTDGRSPETSWETFLDRLFDHFDRDGDGWLNQAEANRIMPLPLPGSRELRLDFARLGGGRTGKVSRAALKACCRESGFTPVVLEIVPPSADDLRLADRILRSLDANADGTLTRAELRRAPRALRRYDLNEDEYLETAELLAGIGRPPRPAPARVREDTAEAEAVVLRLDLGAKGRANLAGRAAGAFRLVPATNCRGRWRLRGRHPWWVTLRAVRATPDVKSARDFLVAQFKAAAGDRPWLTKADMEQDPGLGGFLELLPFADRNGDNKLTLAELETYLALVELGLRAQVWVTVTDHGSNPFPFLDADDDGRLSYRELLAAPDLLGGKAEGVGLPSQFDLSFGGASVKWWGGVRLPAPKRPRPPRADVRAAPRWFRAMDRNGDGVLSPREFVGPPEVFRRLDTDGDGVISAAEAARASGRRAK